MLEDIEIMRSFIFGLFFASSLSYADDFLRINVLDVPCHAYYEEMSCDFIEVNDLITVEGDEYASILSDEKGYRNDYMFPGGMMVRSIRYAVYRNDGDSDDCGI
jgi:hypothetical protein